MNLLGYLVIILVAFSIFLTYKILLKRLKIKSEKEKFIRNFFYFFFISLVLFSLSSLTFILSYSFFWEKVYRAISENKYEAVVIGYKKEIISTTSSFNKTSLTNKKPFYFPKVKYINSEGKEIIKVLDITSNEPSKLGEKVKITDSYSNNNRANTLNLDWVMFFGFSIFTGISAFFTFFISSYITNFNIKKRLKKSFYFGVVFFLINIMCVVNY